MISLTTGQPGAGKTLWTLVHVRALAEKEKREVYYSGIADLKVPGWIELEKGEDWHTVPAGAIVVIDEAQRVFRPRPTGAGVPPHVAKLETHRHAGIDLFVITQHPKLLDANLRRLVGTHRHVMRAFGAKAAVVHEWNETRPDPDLSREGSLSTTWKYPAQAFGWYKSAEVHTHKARIPFRVWLILLSPLILAGIGYGVYASLKAKVTPKEPAAVQAQGVGAPPPGGKGTGVAAYLHDHTPRVPGLAYTAPAFDGAMEVNSAPFPVACIASAEKCRCYTDQATALDVPEGLCRDMASRGAFDPRGRASEGRASSRVRPGDAGQPLPTASPQAAPVAAL